MCSTTSTRPAAPPRPSRPLLIPGARGRVHACASVAVRVRVRVRVSAPHVVCVATYFLYAVPFFAPRLSAPDDATSSSSPSPLSLERQRSLSIPLHPSPENNTLPMSPDTNTSKAPQQRRRLIRTLCESHLRDLYLACVLDVCIHSSTAHARAPVARVSRLFSAQSAIPLFIHERPQFVVC